MSTVRLFRHYTMENAVLKLVQNFGHSGFRNCSLCVCITNPI